LTMAREKDSLILIKRMQAKMKPQAKLIVWGCLPKINPMALSKIYSGPLVGPRDYDFFERILGKRISDSYGTNIGGSEEAYVVKEKSGLPVNNQSYFLTSGLLFFKNNWRGLCTRAAKKTKYWINIASGCTGHCTYCSEHCAFGKIKSRPVKDIISNIEIGIRQNYTLFSIFATDVGAYGRDIGCNLADLLEEIIHLEAKRSFKLILNQVNPFYLKEMAPRLEKIFESGKIAAFDCPVQSGSNRLLKLMGRPYTADEWREYMVRISTRFPNIRLSTHFMVGFPTESDQDFRATMGLLDYPLFIDKMTIFRFSARPSVSASRISNQISEDIKESRSKQLYQKYAYMYLLNSSARWINKILVKIESRANR